MITPPLAFPGLPVSNCRSLVLLASGFFLLLALHCSQAQTTGFNQTAAGPFDYNNTANWVGGTINGIWDTTLVNTASQAATFGANTTLTTSLQIGYDANSVTANARNLTLRADGTGPYTLTLGGDISVSTVSSETLTFGSATANQTLNVNLGGVTRTLTVVTGRTLTFTNVISNGGLTILGGTVNFSEANTYSGATTVKSGTLALNGATASAANSDFTVINNAANAVNLQFNSTTSGNTGTTRAKSVTLSGTTGSGIAGVSASGNAGANSNDVITNALTAGGGYSAVTVTANAAKNAKLTSGSFVRNAGSSTLFRGSNMGLSTIASLTAGSANIVFGTAPTLVGNGTAGQTTIGIIKGAYGDSTSAGLGAAGGLVTYDSTYGVRLLNTSTEYTAAITNGQTTLDNVLSARASGGASQDINLTSASTTIGTLSFKITGAGTNSGVTISGNAGTTLKVSSGVIFASQQVTTANATDSMILSVPKLDLNGTEGVITVFSNGSNNGNTPAPLYISSEITNDGGNGVTFGGTGETILNGTLVNTYTGNTTINSGVLRLDKTGAALASTLNTDLIMNGGTLLKSSNSIADTASVTINGGAFIMDTTTSSGNNGSAETINNLTMTGGSVAGSGGSNSALTINGNMTLSGGQVRLNGGGDVIVLGSTTLNGGVLDARPSSSASSFTALTTLQALSIVNKESGAYTPLIVTGSATNFGAQVTLNGNVTFTGNGNNTNTVLINSSDISLANQGLISLNGTRTFNIGNGAAAVDLSIIPALTNGTTTGGLTKTGLGTLAIGGNSSYTGLTTVSLGTLLINGNQTAANGALGVSTGAILGGNGTIGGAVTINSGGTLAPGNSPGNLTVNNSVTLADGAVFSVELNGATVGTEYDRVTMTGSGSVFSLTGTNDLVLSLGYTPAANAFFFLVDNQGGSAISGIFEKLNGVTTTLTQGSVFTVGAQQFKISYIGDVTGGTFTGGDDLVVQAIPEPATWVLLAFSLTTVIVLRRRRI